MNEYILLFKQILEQYKANEISKSEIHEFLTEKIDVELILNSNETLL